MTTFESTVSRIASTRAIAASAFGAGFGGRVWALVPETQAAAFRARWGETYATRFPAAAARSEIFVTRAGPGAVELGLS